MGASESSRIGSYSDIVTLGHKMVLDILDGPIVVEEKVDGSQFSFGLVPNKFVTVEDGIYTLRDPQLYELRLRSKSQDQTHATDQLFCKGREVVEKLDLHPGWIYRAEYLQKPQHNALAYDRVPTNHIVIYDIETSPSNFLDPLAKAEEAQRLGLECVPCYYTGILNPVDLGTRIEEWLGMQSFLGGQLIEGVVIKNYNHFTHDHKVQMAKYVNDRFKEVHKKAWGKSNPSQGDFIGNIITGYRTEARWEKAIQHLRERGQLLDELKDIGPLLGEIVADVKKEEEEEIKQLLFNHFWKQIARGITSGFPEYYKNRLLGNMTDPMKSFDNMEIAA